MATTIHISDETWDRLMDIKSKKRGMTFDKIINTALDVVDKLDGEIK